MSGDYPGNARKRDAVLSADPPDPVFSVAVEANGSADPSSIRPALAQLTAANLSELQRTLLDAALSAATTRWVTVTCGGCQARSRVELPVPDVRARLQAIQLLLSESLGRAPTAPEVVRPTLPSTAREIAEMPWSEMQALFASLFASEIESLQRMGGAVLVRERVAALSAEQRRLLSRALAETPA
jgi:hypothetical protein